MPVENSFRVIDAHQDLAFSMLSYQRAFATSDVHFMLTETSWRKSGLSWAWVTVFIHPDYQTQEFADAALKTELDIYDELLAHYRGWLVPGGCQKDIALMSRHGGQLGISILMEGAEPVSHAADLESFFMRGVRALGLTWNNKNKYAGGAFAEGGLTGPGSELLDEAARLGIAIDLSHLNEESFWDVIKYRNTKQSGLTLYASHSNAAAVCPHVRNLDDEQLAALRECGGAVGVVLYNMYLDPNWSRTGYGDKLIFPPEQVFAGGAAPDEIARKLVLGGFAEPAPADEAPDAEEAAEVSLEIVLEHIDHLVYVMGERSVGLGSDFDGGLTRHNTPIPFHSFADISILSEAVADRWGPEFARMFMGENWFDFWSQALPD